MKFLPRAFAADAARRERFFAEVRLARQVSHPNVCRVYDVGEIEGQHYLSMEYVDGEDLASLLRRIGRLPQDKALELSRELCAGLAAAHDKKVLHRDLKPANVMIDGRGRARITDFGLAVVTEDGASEGEIAGTPAYMAPEQLAGKGASVRSDVYSLGLVLYELFTGKKAFEAGSLAELRHMKETATPTAPSALARDLDPNVERVILRCLEKDAARRPASALQVSAGLPGGDPLAAALAAGETPSPEMVAAAGESSGLAPRVALACLAASLAGLFIAVLFADRLGLTGRVPLDESPERLALKAEEIATRSGYAARPFDHASGLSESTEYFDYIRKSDQSKERWSNMEAGRPPGIKFWYRTSPRELAPVITFGINVGQDDPPRNVSGMVLVVLDTKGHLLEFEAVPPQTIPKGPADAPDWGPLIAATGLEMAALKPAAPAWVPEDFADSQVAWTGAFPELPKIQIRVEAAAYRGKPTAFRIVWPWTTRTRERETEKSRGEQIGNIILLGLFVTILGGSILIARRNVRLNRGDRRGAFRLAMFVFTAVLASWAIGGTHVASSDELRLFVTAGAGFPLFAAGLVGILYLAIEPFVRRRWPDALVSWTRILSGQFRDPVVGRDILIGALLGVGGTLVHRMNEVAEARFALPSRPAALSLSTLLGARFAASNALWELVFSVFWSLVFFFLLFLLRMVLRNEWLAAAAAAAVFVVLFAAQSETPLIDAGFLIVVFGSMVVVLTRFGLVALTIWFYAFAMLNDYALTRHLSSWYAPSGIFAIAVVAALAIYGFRTTLEGRPVFKGLLDT
jgi:serine/threonine protein kinase